MQVITKYFYPVAAGIEVNIQETHKKLLPMGYNIQIHTSADTLTEKNVLSIKPETVQGLKVRRYPFKWYGFIPKIDWENIDILSLHNFNIVPHFFILLYVLFLKSMGKKKFKVILTPHGGFTPEWRIFPLLGGLLKKVYHSTIGVILINLSVDHVRAVSEWEKLEMIKEGILKEKVAVISNGIEDEAFVDIEKMASKSIKERVKKLGKYIIQIGRIYMIKNYETVIKSMCFLPGDLTFVIVGPVGDNAYLEKLKLLIKKLKLADRVIFIGVIRGVDKYYIIKHAQLMVHMAIWESFCNVAHEGMSQGKVCIVANNSALPYLIRDGVNGFLVDTYDDKMLAKKINYVLQNKNDNNIVSIQTRNKQISLEHSWEKVAIGMDRLINSEK